MNVSASKPTSAANKRGNMLPLPQFALFILIAILGGIPLIIGARALMTGGLGWTSAGLILDGVAVIVAMALGVRYVMNNMVNKNSNQRSSGNSTMK